MTHADKHRFAFILFLLAGLILTWWVFISIYRSQLPSIVVLPNGQEIEVQVADSDYERSQGLSGVDRLTYQEGMLFLHEKKENLQYWMKDMLIPIDIIWLDGDRVVGFEENVQPESEVDLTHYTSPQPIDRVFESAAGFVANYNIKRGDRLDIKLQ